MIKMIITLKQILSPYYYLKLDLKFLFKKVGKNLFIPFTFIIKPAPDINELKNHNLT